MTVDRATAVTPRLPRTVGLGSSNPASKHIFRLQSGPNKLLCSRLNFWLMRKHQIEITLHEDKEEISSQILKYIIYNAFQNMSENTCPSTDDSLAKGLGIKNCIIKRLRPDPTYH